MGDIDGLMEKVSELKLEDNQELIAKLKHGSSPLDLTSLSVTPLRCVCTRLDLTLLHWRLSVVTASLSFASQVSSRFVICTSSSRIS